MDDVELLGDDLIEAAATTVTLIRSQNWKNGGAHKIDCDHAYPVDTQSCGDLLDVDA